MTKNQFICEKLGLPYHSWKTRGLDGTEYIHSKPDFSDDKGAVELLRLFDAAGTINLYVEGKSISLPVAYMRTPGALRDKVAEWFGWKEE